MKKSLISIFLLVLVGVNGEDWNSFENLEEVGSVYYKMIDQNNSIALETSIHMVEDVNSVNNYFGYNLLNYALTKSKYDLIPIIKEVGGLVSDTSFGSYKGAYIKYLNEVNIRELLYFGFPRQYNFNSNNERVLEGVPFIYSEMVLYLLENPFDNIDNLNSSYTFIYNTLGKEDFYKALENYILAFINTDFNWQVKVGNKEYNIDFNFVNDSIDKRGYTRIGGSSSIYGEENLTIDQKKEDYLWTISKFYHRRGEVFGQLINYYTIQLLEELSSRDEEAQLLLNQYGYTLKEIYNQFANNWNNGKLPVYPYDKFDGAKNNWEYLVKIPLHIDGEYLKSQKDQLPLIASNYGGNRIWEVDSSEIHYFKSGKEIIKGKIEELEKNANEDEITEVYKTINLSSYKYSPRVWLDFYFKLKDIEVGDLHTDWILEKVISLEKGSYERVISYYHAFIEELISRGLYRDAVKFYNALKVRGIQHYESLFEKEMRGKIPGAINLDVASYLKKIDYEDLKANSIMKKYLFEEDYEKISGYGREIIVVLEEDELNELLSRVRKVIESGNGRSVDVIRIISPQAFFGRWPEEYKSRQSYEQLIYSYIEFLYDNQDKDDLVVSLCKVVVNNNEATEEIYLMLFEVLDKLYNETKSDKWLNMKNKYLDIKEKAA